MNNHRSPPEDDYSWNVLQLFAQDQIRKQTPREEIIRLLEKAHRAMPLLRGKDMENICESAECTLDEENEKPFKEPKFLKLSLSDLAELKQSAWRVKHIIADGSLVEIYGAPGAGKTFLGLDLALDIAAGLPWCGHDVKSGQVVYCCGEGVSGIYRRVQAWADGWPKDMMALTRCENTFHVIKCVPRLLDGNEVRDFLISMHLLEPAPSLIVFDTFARAMVPGDENAAASVGQAIEALDHIRRETGSGILVLHHSGKDQTKGARGSTALLGAVDTVMSLNREDTRLTLTCEKQKDWEPFKPLSLRLEGVTVMAGAEPVSSCRIRSTSSAERLMEAAKSTRSIFDLLGRPQHAEGLTAGEATGYLDMKRGTFYKGVGPLVEDGSVVKKGTRFKRPTP